MKQDIDRLMAERALDAIVVEGPDGLISANAAWSYMTNGAGLTGKIVQIRGARPQLIFGGMERQQAEQTGLELVPIEQWNMRDLLARFPNRLDYMTELYRLILNDLGVRGRVAIYGTVHANELLALTAALRQVLPDVEIVGDFDDLINEARKTKDAAEIERMADVGRRTCAVVQAVIDFIGAQRAVDDTVVDAQGQAVTIGDIHGLIRRELDRHNLEAPDGTIFAQGRDAGIPHATGEAAAPLKLGQAIVFDIFPRDRTTGYFHDMTRTFAIGYAPPELQRVYDDVQAAFDTVVDTIDVGARTRQAQDLACQVLRQRGHKTPEDEWPLEEGYVHSLGHGLGLEVHEPLAMSSFVDRGDTFQPGTVFTIEPGLYYPSRNLGVRIEDTFVCDADGAFRSLTPFPYDLIIPIKE